MARRGIADDESAKKSDKMPKKGRFIKIMFGFDFSNYLPLPPKFVHSVEHLADQEIQIEDWNGLQWSVKLEQVDGSLALNEGWNKFFLDHSLKEGYILVFEYAVDGHFTVYIFGQTAVEITDFDNVGPKNRKRVKTNLDPVSPDNPLLKNNVQPREKSGPNDSVLHRSKTGNCKTRPKETDGNVMRPSCELPTAGAEDKIGMVNKDTESYGRKERDFLNDTCFETGKKTPAECVTRITDKINTNADGNNTQVNASRTDGVNGCSNDADRFVKKDLDISAGPSHTGKKKVDVNRNVSEKFTGTVEKAPERKRSPSRGVKTDVAKMKRNGTQMDGDHVEKINSGSSDILADKNRVTLSDKGNLSGKVREDTSNPPNDRSERGIAGKRKCPESTLPSEEGKRRLKQEQVGPKGKAPITRQNDQMLFPPVKAEPDLADEAVPSSGISPFTAKVENKSYLELPVKIPSVKRDSGRGKVVYIRDSFGKIWPMINPNKLFMEALVGNWARFCETNGIKPGDECRFQLENEKLCCYRVDVIHK
ncbi:B3 domain-containing protein Os02g0598200 [Striga asiatica]|uniref:B3 domain-containing protein Os02g0598200 n=1 Tax=Striga asiatica TaxID=4170 RepID=A0A5A7PJD3_STRAF|nr:B3 domain-containing protein Os02g0598200 [Striga asiatica]